MSGFFQWAILSAITGSPIGSAIALIVFWFLVDRFTFGVLPDPFRWLARYRRAAQLERVLMNNAHDRRARAELGELLVSRGAYARAVTVLEPNLKAGDDEPGLLLTAAEAYLGAGQTDVGENLLAALEQRQQGFRLSEGRLVAGRWRLQRKDFQGAKESLEALVSARAGTVEGRVLLARALEGLGDQAGAKKAADAAWAEYVAAPAFQRRKDWWWAWRARPSRPLLYAVVIAVLLIGLLKGLSTLPAPAAPESWD